MENEVNPQNNMERQLTLKEYLSEEFISKYGDIRIQAALYGAKANGSLCGKQIIPLKQMGGIWASVKC